MSISISGGGGGKAPDVLLYEWQSPSGSAESNLTSGAWRTVPFDTEVSDDEGHGSNSSGAITLAAGSYRAVAGVASKSSGASRIRIRNTSDNVTIGQGVTNGGNAGHIDNPVNAFFEISAAKTIEVQIYATSGTLEFNNYVTTGDVEVWARLYLEKVE